MTTPVKFELAKLLKEKRFDEPCSHAYKEVESPVLYIHKDKRYNNSFKKEWENTLRKNSNMDNAAINRYSAPTIAEVVMWLYEKHGIWIEVHGWTNQLVDNEVWKNCFQAFVNGDAMDVSIFKTPTEAYEAAIEYTLNSCLA